MPSLGHSFQFDDEAKILNNPGLANPWNFLTALAVPGYSEDKGRLLAWLSLALDHRFHGLDPRGYNTTNLVLHLANTVLLFAFGHVLLRRTGHSRALAPAMGAALFAVHPLASEAVLYLNARGNLLATGFTLAALTALLSGERATPGPVRGFVACALALAALMSKEAAISLVALAPLAWWWTSETDRARNPSRKALVVLTSIVVALGGAIALLSGAAARAASLLPSSGVLLGQAHALVTYLGLTLIPLPSLLSVEHDFRHPPESSTLLAVTCAVALITLTIASLRLRGRDPAASLLLLWPLVTHAPTSLFPRAEGLVEYRAYLPLAGSALLIGVLMERHAHARKVTVPLVVLLATLTATRARAWHSPLSLWRDASAKAPGSARAHNNLGSALEAVGKLDEAIECYTQASALDPAHALSHYNLGTALLRRGRPAAGIEHLRTAIRLRHDLARAHYNLGQALIAAGQETAGRAAIDTARTLDPNLLSTRSSGN